MSGMSSEQRLHRLHQDRVWHLHRHVDERKYEIDFRYDEARQSNVRDDNVEEDKLLLNALLIETDYASDPRVLAESQYELSPTSAAETAMGQPLHSHCSTPGYMHCWKSQGGSWRIVQCGECALRFEVDSLLLRHARMQMCSVPGIATDEWQHYKEMLTQWDGVKQRLQALSAAARPGPCMCLPTLHNHDYHRRLPIDHTPAARARIHSALLATRTPCQ